MPFERRGRPLERRRHRRRDSDLRTDGSHGSTARPPKLRGFWPAVDNGILWRIAPVVLQIVKIRRQNPTAIFTAKTLGDLFLGQSRFLAGFHDHLAKRLHIDGRFLTISSRQSEAIWVSLEQDQGWRRMPARFVRTAASFGDHAFETLFLHGGNTSAAPLRHFKLTLRRARFQIIQIGARSRTACSAS